MLNYDINLFANAFHSKKEARDYFIKNNLDFDDLIRGAKDDNLIEPNIKDLARLLFICKETKASRILEFGCGFSSYIFHNYLSNFEKDIQDKIKYFQITEVHKSFLKLTKNRFTETPINLKCFYELCKVKKDNSRTFIQNLHNKLIN